MDRPSVQTYLFFDGTCEEAMNLYKDTLGASIEFIMRYGESPEPAPPGRVPPGWDKKIMHGSLLINGTRLMVSDDCTGRSTSRTGFALVLNTTTEADADRAFKALSERGQVDMPLTKTFFAPKFGMLTDRFGVKWMIRVLA